MKRVTGIGGVFFSAKNPGALQSWYKTHLGIDVQVWGGASFPWTNEEGTPVSGSTAWMIGDGSNFEPSKAPFMINYRVADLSSLLELLRQEDCQVLDEVSESEYGKFGWVIDPEGNKVELWEPPPGH
ncbi:MAG: VOC family protein [Gammaproteobacteria bacterium]|nr:VOC family protein [Gammaproteobacteria bacterium]MDH5693555.1 VOC family protein [Gammaproteobacteria bacterium]